MLEIVESFTDKYSNVATFIALIPFIFFFVKSMIKILGMTAIERLLTPRKEKSVNNILERIYISIFVIIYFNFLGYFISKSADINIIVFFSICLSIIFILTFLLLLIAYLFKKTYKILVVIFLASYTILIFLIHIAIFIGSKSFIYLVFEISFLSFTLLYIIALWALISLANHHLIGNNKVKYRVKVIRNKDIDQTLENKYLFQSISKNIHVYIERPSDTITNEFYVYYINEDKLIIYFNDKSSTYRRNLF